MGWDLFRDVRFAVRTLARRPGFTFTAVAVLGLGIGSSATVFTLVNRIFFQRPAEVVEPHRLLRAYRSWAPGQGGGALQHADYLYYRDNATTLQGLAAYGGGNFIGSYAAGSGATDQLRGLFVSGDYFDVLGVRPRVGRFFLPEEDAQPGTHPVMVVSEGFWRRALGGDPSAVGRSLQVNGRTFTVVGVAPGAFQGVSPVEGAPDAWFPLAMWGDLIRAVDTAWWERLAHSRSNWLSMVGRLAPGVTFEAAEANLSALSDALTYPGRGEEEGILVTRDTLYRPSQAQILGSISRLLLAVVALVLLIATANVAVLLLSRALTRGREMGIRAALGAGRGRLTRQLLTESLLLGILSGLLGVGLAYALSDQAASLLPLPFPGGFAPDGKVLAAAAGLALGVSVVVGLAPVLHLARTDLNRTMEGHRATRGRSPLRDALVVGQIGLSLVLVSGAVLFGRSFWAARSQDVGFATRDRLVVQANLRSQGYDEEQGRAFIGRSLERLAALPGVRGVTSTRMIAFGGDWSSTIDAPEGATPNAADGQIEIGLNAVSPEYFDVLEIPLVAGRPLEARDGAGDTPACVVNETLARTLFGDADPLGKAVDLGYGRAFTVVGVARDAVYYELGEEPKTQLYAAVQQTYQPQVNFVIHVDGDAPAFAAPAQAALRELDPSLTFTHVTTLGAVFDEQTARYRVSAVLVGLFSALALILAAAGLYGIVAFTVAQRTREIGVRMALGGRQGTVARQVVASGLRLALAGAGLGLVGAVWLRRLTRSLLYETVGPNDPWALAAGLVVMAAVVALASLGPARRATRIDPVEAIRTE